MTADLWVVERAVMLAGLSVGWLVDTTVELWVVKWVGKLDAMSVVGSAYLWVACSAVHLAGWLAGEKVGLMAVGMAVKLVVKRVAWMAD